MKKSRKKQESYLLMIKTGMILSNTWANQVGNVDNYLKCELLTANELREIDVIKADLYLKKSLKAIVWQNICTGVSFKQLRKIYDTFKLQPSVSSGIFKSKLTFSIYCILQQIKYKFRK